MASGGGEPPPKDEKGLTLLPMAFYDFLSYGVGFLSHTQENNVKLFD